MSGNLSSVYTHFNTLEEWAISLFSTIFFYAIHIVKSFNSHISAVVYSFFEFGTVLN